MSDLNKLLLEVQAELKAPKNQYNTFGKYSYRNQEDILEAVKPLLKSRGLLLIITDEIKSAGEYVYVEASVRLMLDIANDIAIEARASAGIAEQKGMSTAQTFGCSSSYARKYALNGMFLIDDVKDDDVYKSGSPDDKNPTNPPTPKSP